MPDVAAVLKEEISRLTRKEVRAAVTPLKTQVGDLRRKLSQQKEQISQLERGLIAQTRSKPSEATTGEVATDRRPKACVSPAALKAQRSRLRISQREMGLLLGVSANTIVGWEAGRSTPRAASREAFAELKGIGARAARDLVACLA